MPTVSKEEVLKMADVAKVALTEDEATRYAESITDIVQRAEDLKNMDLSDVEPATHALEIYDVVREDDPNNQVSIEDALLNSESTEDGQFKVPKMIS
ncbi:MULTISPECIES: Asp-tRNA(Asn)/Glu-tRNA(Gln) amidotransferase subunit GatC [Nosocomiicoccus]|uniref:Aspartyl/glutamyl-tRNA(Asn/Gln) amidotransferase subunit C n=1 Tax=Nosocomiicoccus massiliensis TaxID=1232430 RepID=A0AAF0YLY7_9STAP|nr:MULTISPECIES: Asp-tRNA(Asn)/Glu-tRNA(Gln) amidotransferase subunit GatC [Nosocomiicoccus]OFL48625.1 hypothetical protein HMPREF2767_07590 [Nosocomiicoccus sp. HMSC067E10]OFO55168.1 hypothetical protein HMPREF3029_04820 [Nosocomiicoccus sp. HMSC059G07]OFS61376.1 hypothetical protein HMPREF3177_07935 [Nosocomiicoccus sp. HMSC09A07]WOS96897.1 Asp-tRNA(Asn)/Glu-tRNA(Gln) amidotransferase subunit GatC [Nosocomiicoccus massiliensis]